MKRLLSLVVLVALSTLACSGPQRQTAATPPPAATAAGPAGLSTAELGALREGGVDPAAIRCNTRNMWNPALRPESKATADKILSDLETLGVPIPADRRDAAKRAITDAVQWRTVLSTLIDGDMNNLGVLRVKGSSTADGKPLLLFRTGFTPRPDAPDACLGSLVRAGGVRNAVNLYAGAMPTEALEAAERQQLSSAGGTYVSARDAGSAIGSWREDLREDASPEAKRAAMTAVADIVHQLLQPQGQAPTGNVWIHCGGGMHRTGMVVGVIERCLNGASPEQVAATYARHVAWRTDAQPGGFEAENLAFIQAFDCRLL